jgi:hypothetical protein
MIHDKVKRWRPLYMATVIIAVITVVAVWFLARLQPLDTRPTEEIVWEHLKNAYHDDDLRQKGAKRVAQLGERATPLLLEILKDPSQSRYWGRASVVLQLIGDEAAVEPLISLFENAEGDLDDERFAPMRGFHATMAAIAANGSDKALQYLVENAKPEIWRDKKLSWNYVGFGGESPYHVRFREDNFVYREICALALTGHSRAIQALEEIRTHADNEMWQLWASKAIGAARKKSLEAREAYLNQMWTEEPSLVPLWLVFLIITAAAVLFLTIGWWCFRRFRVKNHSESRCPSN